MKIFYDSNGNVVGSFEGALPHIEDGVKMPGTEDVTCPPEVTLRINDPYDELQVSHLQVTDGEVVISPQSTD